jgi:predicted porin
MKKTLVAIAALAAFGAQAQSTVTMSGIMDAGYQSIKNLGGQQTNQVGQSGARTTTVKLNGTEDLGGGQTANFQFEVQPSIIATNGNGYNATYAGTAPATVYTTATNGAAQITNQASVQSGLVGKGQSFVGLKDAKYGEVQFGTINTGTFAAFAAVSQMGTGVGSGYGSGNTFGDITRVESSMAYLSPQFNGFDFRVQQGTNNDSQFGVVGSTATGVTLRRPRVLDMGAGYTNGPLAVKYGRLESTTTANEASSASVKTTTQLLGAVYDAGVAKVSAATGSIKNNAATTPADYKIQLLAVSVPFGANRVIAQTGSVSYDAGATTLNIGSKVKTSGIALERDLSKRTYVYARYESTDLSGNSAKSYVVNGAASTSVAWGSTAPTRKITTIGVSHAF